MSTLWDVDDAVTTELLVSFHNRFAGGMPAAEALRLAQQDALRSRRPELAVSEGVGGIRLHGSLVGLPRLTGRARWPSPRANEFTLSVEFAGICLYVIHHTRADRQAF